QLDGAEAGFALGAGYLGIDIGEGAATVYGEAEVLRIGHGESGLFAEWKKKRSERLYFFRRLSICLQQGLDIHVIGLFAVFQAFLSDQPQDYIFSQIRIFYFGFTLFIMHRI
ncbi:MAG: hypothetical protein D3910_14235, partial [Candidatus Electrothrix sp. ATG2]|nr:hypothetical protein [Candidatus Electrothrix sp. ATG2]